MTPRLLIRPTRPADGPDCLAIWLDEEMGRYLADPPREKADESHLHFADDIDQDEGWYPMVAVDRETGAFIGTCSVVKTEDDACWDLGYCIHRRYWRQGYGTEMVGALVDAGQRAGARAFTASVAQANAGSNALLRKLGFRVWKDDGSFRKHGTDIVYPEYVYRLDI